MQAVSAPMSQVNTRVDSAVKRQAEDVLELMGSSTAELVRSVFGKVARGAKDYEQIARVLAGEGNVEADDSLLAEGWAASAAFYRQIGVDPSAAPAPERSWDELYAEAMDAHFADKGLIS